MSDKKSDNRGTAKPAAARQATREAHRAKFDWARMAGADTNLGAPAKALAALAAIELLGSSGQFKATRKRLATLCGMSTRAIDRAVKELVASHYWTVELTDGRVARFTLVTPEARMSKYNDWLRAERRFINQWVADYQKFHKELRSAAKRRREELLFQESYEYRSAIAGAVFSRVTKVDNVRLDAFITRLWDGRELDENRLDQVLATLERATDAELGKAFSAPAIATQTSQHHDTDVATLRQVRRDITTQASQHCDRSGSLTSGDDDSHKVLQGPSRSVNPQVAAALGRAPAEETPSPQPTAGGQAMDREQCRLCDSDGVFCDVSGDWLTLLVRGDDGIGQSVKCRHSMAGNLAEIRRLEGDGSWTLLSPTGWPEIDSQYPQFADVPPVTVDGAITGAPLQINDPMRVGEQ